MKTLKVACLGFCMAATVLLYGCSKSDSVPNMDNWVNVGSVKFKVMAPICSDLEKEGIDYAMDPTGGRPSFSVPPENVEAAKKILARHAGKQ
jgi:hypothetical protein